MPAGASLQSHADTVWEYGYGAAGQLMADVAHIETGVPLGQVVRLAQQLHALPPSEQHTPPAAAVQEGEAPPFQPQPQLPVVALQPQVSHTHSPLVPGHPGVAQQRPVPNCAAVQSLLGDDPEPEQKHCPADSCWQVIPPPDAPLELPELLPLLLPELLPLLLPELLPLLLPELLPLLPPELLPELLPPLLPELPLLLPELPLLLPELPLLLPLPELLPELLPLELPELLPEPPLLPLPDAGLPQGPPDW